jgi:hypothetical protein
MLSYFSFFVTGLASIVFPPAGYTVIVIAAAPAAAAM